MRTTGRLAAVGIFSFCMSACSPTNQVAPLQAPSIPDDGATFAQSVTSHLKNQVYWGSLPAGGHNELMVAQSSDANRVLVSISTFNMYHDVTDRQAYSMLCDAKWICHTDTLYSGNKSYRLEVADDQKSLLVQEIVGGLVSVSINYTLE